MKVITWVLTAFLALVVIALGLVYLLPGWDLYIVQSDSMTPVFQARDMIVTRPVPGMVRPGDIITYGKGTQKVTHRAISIEGDDIITKGDANEAPDPYTMSYSNVAGVYLFKVPRVGYVTEFVSTKRGWYLSIVLPAGILVLALVREIIREAFKKEDDESFGDAVPPWK